MNLEMWAKENLIHKIYAGSRLYGTERPDSDWDERGVCLMPPQSLLGLTRFDQYNRHNENEDVVIYGLTKFFKLSLDCNPNILELLFAPSETWMIESEQWEEIYANRHWFLCQRVRYTFSGYARSQLKRLQGHYQWLTNPPDHQPELGEFDGYLEKGYKGGQKKVFPNLQKQKDYEKAVKHWKQYQTWLKERNPARAKLEALYGYDTKHACNLVRMMLQGKTLLKAGTFNPRLDDTQKKTVLDVLYGKWDYHELLDWANEKDALLQSMDTVLPEKSNRKQVELLLMKLNHSGLKASGIGGLNLTSAG